MKKELPAWRRHVINAHGAISHLSCATDMSRFGEANLESLLNRRPRRMRAELREIIMQDSDGAYRVHGRIDGRYVNNHGVLVGG